MAEGFTCVPNNVLKMLAPHPHLLATYMVIKSRCISSTGTWVSQETLAKELEVDVRTVKRRMKVLQEWGLISRKSRGKYRTKLTLLEHVGGDTGVPSRGDTDVPHRSDTDVPPIRRLRQEDESNDDREVSVMGWKDDAEALEKQAKVKTDTAKERKERRRQRRAENPGPVVRGEPGEPTHKEVLAEFTDVFKRIVGRTPGMTPKDRRQAKLWVAERGDAHVCINMVRYVGDNYETLREKFGWNGLSFGMIYGYRDSIFLAMKAVEKEAKAYKKIKTGGTW